MASTKTEKVKLGIFTLLVIVVGIAVTVALIGSNLRTDDKEHSIFFEESVSGLKQGSAVTLSGVRVGQVTAIRINPKNVEQVEVSVAIESSTPIKSDMKAFLQMQGVTGLKFIDLQEGTKASPALKPGEEIKAGVGLFTKLANKAETMSEDAGNITGNIERIVSEDNAKRVDRILIQSEELVANLNVVSKELAKTMVVTRELLDRNATSIDRTLKNASRASAQVGPLMREMNLTLASSRRMIESSKFDQMMLGFDQTNALLRGKLEQVDVATLTKSLNTFQSLLVELIRTFSQNQDHVRAMFLNARQTTDNVKVLSRELRDQPSKLIFDDKPEPRKLPSK